MNRALLKEQWLIEEQKAFQGWDFSVFEGRILEEKLPWDYRNIVLSHLKPTDQMLDMGTGGGEFLLGLGHPYEKTTVTEGYMPNYELCQATLAPLGIEVSFASEDLKLSFDDESFDVVINRHESYDINEVYRILKPDGVFITQQVGADNNRDLAEELLGPMFVEPIIYHSLEMAWESAVAAGFAVSAGDKCYYKVSFKDIDALVYFVKIISWEFPGFSVKGRFEKLCELQEKLESALKVESTGHRYYLIMKK